VLLRRTVGVLSEDKKKKHDNQLVIDKFSQIIEGMIVRLPRYKKKKQKHNTSASKEHNAMDDKTKLCSTTGAYR
jgi:hypothetical protein